MDSDSVSFEEHEFVALRQKNADLEHRLAKQEQREFSAAKEQIADQYKQSQAEQRRAEQILAKAIAESNGDDAAQALRYRDENRLKTRELEEAFSYVERQEKHWANARTKPKSDPSVTQLAQKWIDKNPWYDKNGRDLDSKIALIIDQELINEGYAPSTAHYWKELDKRVKARLPHQFEEREESHSQKRQVYISPARKEALVLAGVWDDPQLRMKYVKRYQAWDRENA